MMIKENKQKVSAILGITITSLYFIISFMNITNLYMMYLLATLVSIYFIYSTHLISKLTPDDWVQITKDSMNKNKKNPPLLNKINGWMLSFLFIFILFGIIDYWWFIVSSMTAFMIYVIYQYITLDIGTKLKEIK